MLFPNCPFANAADAACYLEARDTACKCYHQGLCSKPTCNTLLLLLLLLLCRLPASQSLLAPPSLPPATWRLQMTTSLKTPA
jgi:hypothetical protein